MAGPAATESPELRLERKFLVSELSLRELETLVRFHPAIFQEIYPPRQVNNIYLDSVALENYVDNTDGIADRVKVRVRWYGELFGRVRRPRLEVKRKRGLLGQKESAPLAEFFLSRDFDRDTLATVFAASELPARLSAQVSPLLPSLLNCYRRAYFRSADGRVRLTLDSERRFFRLGMRHNCFLASFADVDSTVVELKYSPELDQRAAEIASGFPFRMTKSSKYAQGIELMELA